MNYQSQLNYRLTQLIRIGVIACFLAPAFVVAQQFDGLSKPAEGTWLLDDTGQLDPAAAGAINKLCDEVTQKYSGEIFVVFIDSTDGQNHRRYATRLFNSWGIGSKWKDNGILVFAALRDRKSEIILGRGVDSDRQVDHAEVITDHFLIPHFKEGDYGQGFYTAARACAARIFGMSDLQAPADLPSLNERANTKRDRAEPTHNRARDRSTSPSAPIQQRPPEEWKHPVAVRPPSSPVPWLIGLGLGVVALIFGGRYYLRYRTRVCNECGNKMVLLTEEQDDEFLAGPEILEERLGSVDYDVWACFRCEFVDKFRYGAFFTQYASCPRCSYRTKYEIKKTLIRATTSHGGRVLVRAMCQNCDYHHSYTYNTPQLSDDDDDSGFSFGSGSSSFGGFGGGSSGGSFGGSSSGSGASGSW